jgi:hypothetical protein
MLKLFRGIENDIDGKYAVFTWALNNNQIDFILYGESDETGFELNSALQIWHLQK